MDARDGPRLKRRIACELESEGRVSKGMVVDLSAHGLFVQTGATAVPSDGSQVEVRLLASPGVPPMTLRARVARRQVSPALLGTVAGRGVGLHILWAPPEYAAALDRWARRERRQGDVAEATEADAAAPDAATEPVRVEDAAREPAVREAAAPARGEIVPVDNLEAEVAAVSGALPSPLAEGVPERSAIVVDEGELVDVYDLLEELGARPVRARLSGPTRFDGWAKPPRVFVAAARCALSIRVPQTAVRQGVVTIAVAEAESQTLCALMRRLGYQFVVRRPVHPEALRLLLTRALYREGDHRSEPRFAFGCEVTWWRRWKAGRASMLEISPGGCRLLAPEPESVATTLWLRIPRAATHERALWLRGQVIRSEPPAEAGAPGVMAVVWDDDRPRARARLGLLLARRSVGPATRAEPAPIPHWIAAPLARLGLLSDWREPGASGAGERRERRRRPRVLLHQEVVALDEQAHRAVQVLFGRDLSEGGIRVEPHPDLRIGERLSLAIYEASCPDPVVITAEVIRNDGERGVAMRFPRPSRRELRQIRRIVESLPSVETPGPGEEAERVVVTRIVDRRSAA
jgi:hypothetical protein